MKEQLEQIVNKNQKILVLAQIIKNKTDIFSIFANIIIYLNSEFFFF